MVTASTDNFFKFGAGVLGVLYQHPSSLLDSNAYNYLEYVTKANINTMM